MANKNISVGVKINGDAKNFKSAAEEAQKASDKLKQSLDKTSKQGSSGFKGLSATINTMKVAAVAAYAAIAAAAIKMGKDMIRLAANAEGVKTAFDRLNRPTLLKELQEATRGTVDNVTLMQKAVQAENFKIPLSELATYFKFATNRAIQTGESVDYLVDSIITGIGRKSSMVLDNLGISLVELQEEMKKTGDFAKAASNIIKKGLGEMGDVVDTTAIKVERLKTSWQNFKTSLGSKIIESDFGQGLIKIIEDLDKSLNKENRPYKGASMETLSNVFNTKQDRFNELDSLPELTPKLQKEYDLLHSEMNSIVQEMEFLVKEQESKVKSVEDELAALDAQIAETLKERNKLLEDIAKKQAEITEKETKAWIALQNEEFSYWERQMEAAKEWDAWLDNRNKELQDSIFGENYWENQAQAAADWEEWINKVKIDVDKLSNAGLSLADTFEDAFRSMTDGWDSFSEATKEAITRLLTKLVALITAYIILNALTGGAFGAAQSMGSFILKGFGLEDLKGINPGNVTGKSAGIGSSGANITLSSDIKGRDIFLSNNRYSETLIKNT